jgi:hypothetical protein
MSTNFDEMVARQRIHVLLPKLSEDEIAASLRMINSELPLSQREAAIEQLADSSDNALELLAAFYDLCTTFALCATPATSATEVN